MSNPEIPADVAEELYECANGERVGDWMRLAAQSVGSGRWREQFWLVVSRGEGTFGIPYAVGLTEYQDNEYPWAPSWGEKPAEVELTPLVGVQVTSTTYLTEKEYTRHLAKAGDDA